jgi:polyhydroxyalkanoate synthesis regulator phasin
MLKEQLERSFLIGIGLLSITREKAREFAEEMVKQGQVANEEIKELTDTLVERGEEARQVLRQSVREEVKTTMNDMNIATAEELAELRTELEVVKAELLAHKQVPHPEEGVE